MATTSVFLFEGPNTSSELSTVQKFIEDIMVNHNRATIDLQGMTDIDLAGFNLLISSYVKAMRTGTEIKFTGCHLKKLKFLQNLTRFNHVFK